MTIEKISSEITADIESRLEALAQFINDESLKSDHAVNGSNWLIFERYNREFNAIALQMGYDLTTEGNEDWTAVKAINTQLVAPEWYEGKSRAWLQQCRRILRVACEIHEKCIADNALDELDFKGLSYEQCRLVSNNSLPISEKREMWEWIEREQVSCRKLRIAIRDRVEAHKHLEGAGSDEMEEFGEIPELEGEPRSKKKRVAPREPLDNEEAKAIATEFIARAKSGEITQAEKLIAELTLRVRR